MLKIMRRHAGWGLKVVLGIIIVSFAFFFGYNEIQRAGQLVAMKINDHEISFDRYNFFYDTQFERFRQIFQSESGEIPEFVKQSVQSQTQRFLAQRVLLTALAKQLGVMIPA